MTVTYYPAKGLIGGGADDIDNVDGNDLNDGDIFLTEKDGVSYRHQVDADGNVAEQSPSVIRPDTNPGTKIVTHNPDSIDIRRGFCVRPKFSWVNANTITIGPGAYHTFDGTNHRIDYWVSDLTYTVVTNGAPDWVYIYIDESAVDTRVVNAGSALLTTTQIIDNATEPVYSASKGGWYNGSDRCIFGVYSVANDVVEFFHDGNTVFFADAIENQAAVDIDNTFTDIGALIIPKFTTLGIVNLRWINIDAASIWYWRTNGQTGATGKMWIDATGARYTLLAIIQVITDDSQVIEIRKSTSDANTMACNTVGWKFPIGL